MNRIFRAVTLMELIVCIILLSVIVLGLATISTFSSFQVRSSEQRSKLQFEASTVVEHMTKEFGKAIGNEVIDGADSVIDDTKQITSNYAIHIYKDLNGNGQRDALGTDHWVVYQYTGNQGNAANRYQVWFCPSCDNKPCNNCAPNWGDLRIANRITYFKVTKPTDPLQSAFVNVQVRACWDPTQPATCGTPANPQVEMNTTLRMPSVTTN